MCTDFLINMGICFEIFGNITLVIIMATLYNDYYYSQTGCSVPLNIAISLGILRDQIAS